MYNVNNTLVGFGWINCMDFYLCLRHLVVKMLFDLFSLLVAALTVVVLGQDCTLDDVQFTKGNCQRIRNCTFAIKNLFADVPPKICNGRIICCPTEETVAEKKCQEWRSYLHTPLKLDPEPLPDPLCPLQQLGQSFIVGGRDAKRYEFPHAAALGYGQLESELHYSCGATLISDEFVLTAGHCIRTPRGPPTFVLLGDITLEILTSSFRQIIPISEIIPNPNYKPPLIYHDIALIRLKEKVELSRYLLPACLPRGEITHHDIVEAIGWGTIGPGEPQAQTLQAVNLTLLKKNDCDPYYTDTSDRTLRFPDGLKRSQLCAVDSGKDTCNGDSGGSITQNEFYKGEELRCLFRIVGVTSFGAKLCGFGTPGVYTNVLSYVPWIERVVFGSSLEN